MNITEQKFYHYVSSATNPEGFGIFEMVQDDLTVAKSFLASLLGSVLYGDLVIAQDNDISPLRPLCIAAERYICLHAFDRAIPSLDLVLTPTGFGVVSNANVAPASADRVARLARSVRDMKDSAFDDLLDLLRGNPKWCDEPIAKHYFRSLVWTGAMLRYFGFPNEQRSKLYELSPQISKAERSLVHIISPDLHSELTSAIRTNNTTDHQDMAISLCISYIASAIDGKVYHIENCRKELIAFLDDNIEFFPSYAASSAFRANHYRCYENGEKDSCFFFG